MVARPRPTRVLAPKELENCCGIAVGWVAVDPVLEFGERAHAPSAIGKLSADRIIRLARAEALAFRPGRQFDPPEQVEFNALPTARRRSISSAHAQVSKALADVAFGLGRILIDNRVVIGFGPAFDLARHLDLVRLPFLFATGYDQAVVPDDLRSVVRLEKPFRPAELINAAASVYQTTQVAGR